MIFGEERFFIIEHPDAPQGILGFFLKYWGKDKNGLKMKGAFPKVWTMETGKMNGPLLFDEDSIYEVVAMEYEKSVLWIKHVFESLK